MEAIYPITALQKNNAEIKARAREQLVHVTENGRAAYVFASEEVLDEIIARKCEEAVWEAQAILAIDRGLNDLEAGRYVEGWDALEAEVKRRRALWQSNPEYKFSGSESANA